MYRAIRVAKMVKSVLLFLVNLFLKGLLALCGMEVWRFLTISVVFIPEVSGWAEGVYWALFAQGESCFAVFSAV